MIQSVIIKTSYSSWRSWAWMAPFLLPDDAVTW